MERTQAISKRNYYILISLCALFVVLASVEVIAKVKDATFFRELNEGLQKQGQPAVDYSTYTVGLMSTYLAKIIIPVGLGLSGFLAYVKTGVGKLFVFSWGLFTLAGLATHLLSFELSNVFYYLFIFIYLLLFVQLVRLAKPLPEKTKEAAK